MSHIKPMTVNVLGHTKDYKCFDKVACETCCPRASSLVIRPNNKENTFLTTSPFAINKALLGISGEMKSVRKLGSGDLMVETSRKSQ